jgi:hypothetical protein
MKKYIIKLSPEERTALTAIANKQRVDAQAKLRARVFLATDTSDDGPAKTDQVIAAEVGLTVQTIEKLRAWAMEVGPLAALKRRPSTRVFTRKLDGRGEAKLIVLAKQQPPVGHNHWTLQLLADKLVELKVVDCIDDNTVDRTLKKMSLSLT